MYVRLFCRVNIFIIRLTNDATRVLMCQCCILHAFALYRYYVISTPDRSANQGKHDGHHLVQGGPPENGAHVREWTHNELAVYATHSGFNVIEVRRRRGDKVPRQNTMWLLLELQSTDNCRDANWN